MGRCVGSEETSLMLCCGSTSGKEANFVSDRRVQDSMFLLTSVLRHANSRKINITVADFSEQA